MVTAECLIVLYAKQNQQNIKSFNDFSKHETKQKQYYKGYILITFLSKNPANKHLRMRECTTFIFSNKKKKEIIFIKLLLKQFINVAVGDVTIV